jgi:hypothetical protein
VSRASASALASSGTARKSGVGRPAARNARRASSLLRLAAAAAGGLPGSPNAALTCAARTVGRSPTAITASGGRCAHAVVIASIEACS